MLQQSSILFDMIVKVDGVGKLSVIVNRQILYVVEEQQIKWNLSRSGLLAEQAGMKDPGWLF